ncbi:MAG: universal stress protein [Candidatus Obscuribacterales bacterium]|nr:universal stress protein [Candidatus Obscuribacterales bacterium]
MSFKSILLGLSGSEQSKWATEVAFEITGVTGGTVTAVHVIDTSTIWELLRNDKPGLIGSSCYVDAYQALSKIVRSIAHKLADKYDAIARGRSIIGETIIDQGNPITVISSRAKQFDLVVIGHQPACPGGSKERRSFIRYAIAEGLAHECPRPLLVVQRQVEPWESMTILVSMEHINYSWIERCLDFADALQLVPKVVALSSGIREESPEEFGKNLKQAVSRLENVSIEAHEMEGMAIDENASLSFSSEIRLDWYPDPLTLLVIGTRRSGDERLTVFDTTPDLFVRNLGLPSILLYPEENSFQVQDEKSEADLAVG